MKILFCDWNGTILDDVQIWDNARCATFRAFGVNPPTIAEYLEALESGDYQEPYLKLGIKASREELNAVYIQIYKSGLNDVKLSPSVKTILKRLNGAGVHIVLLTTQQEALVIPLLVKFRIKSLFHDIQCHIIDKRATIEKIFLDKNADPRECFLVGDSPSDIRHAKKSGIVSIAFLAGYAPENLLRNASAEHYISTFEELLMIV